MPKSSSNRSLSKVDDCGKNEKMPPPLLSMITIRRSISLSVTLINPLMSCIMAMSPINNAVGLRDAKATPTAVETTPSMPFTPLFANTFTPSRGAANHSTSRIGMLDDRTRLESIGNAPSNRLATKGSVISALAASSLSIVDLAILSRRFHSPNQD